MKNVLIKLNYKLQIFKDRFKFSLNVREKVDRHFGNNPTTDNFPIGTPYRNSGFRLSPTLT